MSNRIAVLVLVLLQLLPVYYLILNIFDFLLSQLAVAVAAATCWTATAAVTLASLHCDALPHPVLACLLLLRHRRSCLIVVLKSVLIHCPTALLPMPLQHLLVLLRRLYCCCPQLIVASFPLSPVYYRGRCHHTLWRQMLLHRPTMLFPFRWAWQQDSCCQNHCTCILLAQPLHHNAVAKAAALAHCCEATATLLPRLLYRHAVSKAAASHCCCRSCFTTMVWYKPLHCHAVAATLNVLLSWCSCRHSAPLCCCCRFQLALSFCFFHRPAFASCAAVFAVATG